MATSRPTATDLGAFQDAEAAMRLTRTKVALVLGALLMPLGGVLDYSLNPHMLGTFSLIRATTTLILLAGLVGVVRGSWEDRIGPLSLTLLLVPAMAICLMIFFSVQAAESYFFGLILLMVFVQLLGFTAWEAFVYAAVTIVAYVVAVVANGLGVAAPEDVALGLFFLLTTGAVAVVICQLNYRNRLTDFLLRRSLDEKNHQLENVDRQRMDFLANVSHELRTPLSMIIAPLDQMLATRGQLPAAIGQPVALVRRNAERLRVLVDDLLDVVRLDHRTFRLQFDDVDAREVLQEILAIAAPLAGQRDVQLESRCVTRPLDLRIDVERFERVLMNLLSNAFKFSPAGGTVQVGLRCSDGEAIFEVLDEGPGIPAEQRPYVFDRMFQAPTPRPRAAQGLGLGLAISKEIVQWHGGTISLQEAPSGGCHFLVSLPLAEAAPSSPSQPATAAEQDHAEQDRAEQDHAERAMPDTVVAGDRGVAEALAETETEAETLARRESERATEDAPEKAATPAAEVLVIDDEPDLRSFLRDSLADEFGAVSAATGAAGIEQAKTLIPRCILLDFMLPDADGLAVLRRLRSLPELRDTKIIMLTAHFDENVKIEALQRGADDFLSKPFGVTEVRARVAHLIRSSRLQAALRAEQEELRRSLEKLAATESQLFHSEKMRAIASLAAGLLHEINNPVHYTLMAARALRQDLVKQRDPSETIDDIEEGIGRIAEIVSDLRAFAYPQEENVQKAFPLGEAVVTALRFAAHEAHGIRLEADDTARGTLPVVGSRSQITQVLLNLVLNSVRALRTEPVGDDPVVMIRAVRKGDRVEVTVRDNGPGIPAEIQPRVMEPFFTTSEPGQGIGLGLSICHTIVNSHGGQLVLDSTPEDGTHITFDLPLLSESATL